MIFVSYSMRSALAEPAGVALAAAFFIDNRRFSTLGAQVADLHTRGAAVRAAAALRVDADGLALAVGQVFAQHLPHPVRQGAHAVGAEAQRAPAADAGQL